MATVARTGFIRDPKRTKRQRYHMQMNAMKRFCNSSLLLVHAGFFCNLTKLYRLASDDKPLYCQNVGVTLFLPSVLGALSSRMD